MFKKAYSHIAAAARGLLMLRPVHSPHVFEGGVPDYLEASKRPGRNITSRHKLRRWERMGMLAFHKGKHWVSPFTPGSKPDQHWVIGWNIGSQEFMSAKPPSDGWDVALKRFCARWGLSQEAINA